MVAESVTVQIYGEQYTVKAGDNRDHIQSVARMVDEKMREVASSGKVVATSKIAILAALNIADELVQARTALAEEPSGDTGRLDAVITRLVRALEESS